MCRGRVQMLLTPFCRGGEAATECCMQLAVATVQCA
jgi:hypothetical protein